MSPQLFRHKMTSKLDRVPSSVMLTLPMSCQICFGKVKQPVICPNCHVFCRDCCALWSQRNDCCATCRVPVTKDSPYRTLLGGEAVSEEDRNGSFCYAEVRRLRAMQLIDSYEDEIERLSGTVTELQAKNAELLQAASEAAAISEIGRKLSEATRLYDQIEADLRKLQRDNDILRRANEALIRENERLKTEATSASTAACSPSRPSRFTVAALESQVERLRREAAALEEALELSESREQQLLQAAALAAAAAVSCSCASRSSKRDAAAAAAAAAPPDARSPAPVASTAASGLDPVIAATAVSPAAAPPAELCGGPPSILFTRSVKKKLFFGDSTGSSAGLLGIESSPPLLPPQHPSPLPGSAAATVVHPSRTGRLGCRRGAAAAGGDDGSPSPAKKRSSAASDVTTFYGGVPACTDAMRLRERAVDGDSEFSLDLPSPVLPSTPLKRLSLATDSCSSSPCSSSPRRPLLRLLPAASSSGVRLPRPALTGGTAEAELSCSLTRLLPDGKAPSGVTALSCDRDVIAADSIVSSDAAAAAAASAELEHWNVSATEEMIGCIMLLNAAESKVLRSGSDLGSSSSQL